MKIAEDALSHARWIAIFDAVGKGTFENKEGVTQFILEEKTGSVDQKGPVKIYSSAQGLVSSSPTPTH